MEQDQRIAPLENALRESQKELSSLKALYKTQRLEALGRLAGGVAHDFNNLMTGILGIIEDLSEEIGPHDERQEDLRQVIFAAQKATRLTKQLMALGGRQVATPSLLNVNDVILEMKPLLTRFLRDGMELQFSFLASPSSVSIDKNQLEQMVMDLVLNARDATPSGGVIVLRTATVCGALENFGGDCIEIAVEDSGVGMDACTLEHLFEPFYTTKKIGKGSGLGLATVYGIVKQNGGDILVSSHPGKGSLFRIILPTAQVAASRPSPESARATPVSGSETILVVEDEEIVRKVVVRALRRAGYQVSEASCAQAAIALYQGLSAPLDLLLTDVVMPGMNGRQLAEHLDCGHRKISVLYMSGHTADVIMQHGLVEPGVAFIEKTFSPNALCRRVREVLDQRPRRNTFAQDHRYS